MKMCRWTSIQASLIDSFLEKKKTRFLLQILGMMYLRKRIQYYFLRFHLNYFFLNVLNLNFVNFVCLNFYSLQNYKLQLSHSWCDYVRLQMHYSSPSTRDEEGAANERIERTRGGCTFDPRP